MGQCMTTQIPKDIQYLQQVIDYVHKIDLEYTQEPETNKENRIGYNGSGYALGIMQLEFGWLKHYVNGSYINFRDMLKKTYNFVLGYYCYIRKLEHPEKQIYFPIKNAIIVFLQSFKDEYYTTGQIPKSDLIISEMAKLDTVYNTCIMASIEWEHEITKLVMNQITNHIIKST